MEVGLKILADDFHTMQRKHIVSAYFTFVGMDENLKPIELPQVIPQTDDERRRFAKAEQRRTARMTVAR